MFFSVRLGLFVALLLPIENGMHLIFNSWVVSILCGILICSTWIKWDWTLLGLVGIAFLNRSPQSQIISPQSVVVVKAAWIIIFGFIWWIQNNFLKHHKESVPSWLGIYLLGWGFITILSMFNAKDLTACIHQVIVCFSGIILFFVVWYADVKLDKKIVIVMLLTAGGVACLSILQYFILRNQICSFLWPYLMSPKEQFYIYLHSSVIDPIFRVSGTFMHPNTLGTYFFIFIPFICTFFAIKSNKIQDKVILTIGLLLMFAGLFTTNSRNSLFATLISLSYLGIHRGHRWLIKAGVLCLVIIGITYIFTTDSFFNYAKSISRYKYGISSRGTIWSNSIQLIKVNPFLGFGPGNFPFQYYNHFGFFVYDTIPEIVEQSYDLQMRENAIINSFHAHNIYIQVFGEYGIIGLLLLLSGFIALIWHVEKRAHKLTPGSFGHSMALGTASFCIGYMVLGIFDSYAGFTEMGLMFVAPPLISMGMKSL